MTRFDSGDVLVAATDVDDSHTDLRRRPGGAGRILHLNSRFELRQELWTQQTGLVVGIGLHPEQRTLYAADPVSQTVVAFASDGRCLGALEGLPKRPFGAVAFDRRGQLILGVHSTRSEPPDDGYGSSNLFVWNPGSGELEGHSLSVDGGHTGWHGVTSISYEAASETLYYCSEGGRRIARYDLSGARQLDDFLQFSEDDSSRAFGVALLPDGRILATTGDGASLLSEAAELLNRYEVPSEKGWTRITLPPGPVDYFYLNNFLEGILQKRCFKTGQVQAELDIKKKFALCGVAEVP